MESSEARLAHRVILSPEVASNEGQVLRLPVKMAVMEGAEMKPANGTCWKKFLNWFKHNDKGKWLEDMRGMLSLVSTMITTITFQSSVNPPGGVLQASDVMTIQQLEDCSKNATRLCPGDAILAVLDRSGYHAFQVYNTFCFVASLSVTLFLVSGVPLNHRLPIWILSFGMIFTLTSLALTYLSGLMLITPGDNKSLDGITNIVVYSIIAWFAIVGIVTIILTIRFLVWLVRKCIEVFKCMKSIAQRILRGRFSQCCV